jgi:hypothetical protein
MGVRPVRQDACIADRFPRIDDRPMVAQSSRRKRAVPARMAPTGQVL